MTEGLIDSGVTRKSRRLNRAVSVALAMSTTVLLAGTAASAATASASPLAATKMGGTLKLGSPTGAPTTLDPDAPGAFLGAIGGDGYAIYGSLFTFANETSNNGKLVGDLATGYKYSNDFKTLTIKIRPGVKFSDGTPFNAQAVVFNLDRSLPPNATGNTTYLQQAKSIKATGPDTVAINFSAPNATFIGALAGTTLGLIASPTAFKSEGAAKFGTAPVGAGPFKVTQDVPGGAFVMAKNPTYWDAKHVYINEIDTINIGTSSQATFNDLQNGSIDSAAILGTQAAPVTVQQLGTLSDVVRVNGQKDLLLTLVINVKKAPFNNPAALQALDYCTDRVSLANNVEGGFNYPAYIYAAGGSTYYPGDKAAKADLPYQFNVAKGTRLAKSVPNFTFTFLEGGGQGEVIAAALQQMWAKCGIKANVTQYSSPGVLGQDEAEGNFQVSFGNAGGIPDPGAPGANDTRLIPTPNSSSFYMTNTPQVAKLVGDLNLTTNKAKIQKLWDQIWKGVDKSGELTPLIYGENIYYNNKCIKGAQGQLSSEDFTHAYFVCTPS